MWTNDLVNCLESSTVENPRRDEANAIKQQYLPKSIYKYRRDCSDSRDNLETDTIWLSSPDSYNDPYDSWYTFPPDVAEAALTKALDGLPTAHNIRDALPAVLGRLVDAARSELQGWRGLTKVCSFSAIGDSMLMWSHYADSHKGFCLEYDLEGLKTDDSLRRHLWPVIYSDRIYDLTPFLRELVIGGRQDVPTLSPLLAVLRKSDAWEYEQEWRVVSLTATVTLDHSRSVPTPSRVFLGSKMEATSRTELLAICEQKNIATHQMRLADDRYKLLSEPFLG